MSVNMKVIGLTGGIGTGKSTVAGFLAELGTVVLDLDKVGHDVLKKDTGAYRKAIKEFGQDIVGSDGEIDRARLGKIVFNSPDALKRLNKIVHPAIDAAVEKKIKEYTKQGVKAVVLEAAAMLEAEKAWQADEIWATTTPEAVILKRLKERSGYSYTEAKTRIKSQMDNLAKLKRADVVIDTDCTLDELKKRVKAEWEKLQERF